MTREEKEQQALELAERWAVAIEGIGDDASPEVVAAASAWFVEAIFAAALDTAPTGRRATISGLMLLEATFVAARERARRVHLEERDAASEKARMS